MPTAAAPKPRAETRPGPRPAFSRDAIVTCALRLMEREGHAALSFRAVARELDMTVGALSRYFSNLADLEDAVAARVVAGIKPIRAGTREQLRERIADFGMQIFRISRTHPYLADIHGPVSATVIARTMTQSLEVMQDAGVDLQRALLIYSVISNLAQSWGVRGAVRRNPQRNAAITAAIAAQLGNLHPKLAKLMPKTLFAVERGWFLLIIDGLLK